LDIPSKKFKTGIANRALKPILGIVDTLNTDSCPTAVHISSGLDVVSVVLMLGMNETEF
jgi:hydroxyacid-oxoacid transhydrogenase